MIPNKEQLKSLTFWRWSTFAVCIVGYIGYYLCRTNLPMAFSMMEQEFGYTNTQLGLIAAYSEVAYALGKFINGPLADKFGGRRFFLLGMIGAIMSNIAFTQFGTLSAFIIVWCICRYFLSMGWGGLAKMIGEWFHPSQNGTIMGFVSINFQFGGVLATLLAAAVVSQGYGWKMVFFVPSVVLAIICVLSAIFSRQSPNDVYPGVVFGGNDTRGSENISSFAKDQQKNATHLDDKTSPLLIAKGLFKIKAFQHILIFSFLTTFLRSIFFFWTPKFLIDLGLGTTNAIFKSAIFPLLGCISTIFIGWYTDRKNSHGNRAPAMCTMLLGLVISTALIGFLTPFKTEYSNIIVLLLGASGFFLLGPYSMSSGALTLDIAGPKAAGTSTGIIDGLGYLGGAIASYFAGYLSDQFGWQGVFFVVAFIALTSIFSAYKIGQHSRR